MVYVASRRGTTLYVRDLPEDLVRELKVLAAQRGTTLREVVAEALRAAVRMTPEVRVAGPGELEADIAWYEANRAPLAKEYPNEYLAIVDHEVVDHDPDFASLVERTLERYDRPVLMPDTRREQRTVHLRSPRYSGA